MATNPENIKIWDESSWDEDVDVQRRRWPGRYKLLTAIEQIASKFFTEFQGGYWCPIYIKDELGKGTHGQFSKGELCGKYYPGIYLAVNVNGKELPHRSILSTLLHEIKHFLDFIDDIYLEDEYAFARDGYNEYYISLPELAARDFERWNKHLITEALNDKS